MGALQILTRNPFIDEKGTPSSDCNCDCACPNFGGIQLHRQSKPSQTERLRLVLPEQLYITRLLNDFWLACNPLSSSTKVAVISESTKVLLTLFRAPTSLAEITSELAANDISLEEARPALQELVDLEILVGVGWRPAPPAEDSDQLTAWLHVTNECNLRCTYCYLHKTPDAMSEQVMRDAISAVVRSAALHHYHKIKLKFAGGEATLNFPLVLNAYDFAHALTEEHSIDLDAVVLSNGIGITHAMTQQLKSREIRLMISLDGLDEYNDVQRVFANGKGSSLSVTRSIDRLLGWGLVPDISITVTMHNLAGLPELMRFVLHRNLPFSINLCRQPTIDGIGATKESDDEALIAGLRKAYREIEDQLPERTLLGAIADRANLALPHSRTCGVGRNYVVINEKGNVAPCQMIMTQTIGTIQDLDLVTMIQSDRNPIRNLPVDEKEPCRSCSWRYWCTGGCALYTHWSTGRYDVRSPYCRVYKAIFPEVLRLEGLSILKQAQKLDVVSGQTSSTVSNA